MQLFQKKTVRVLIVDDSATVRKILSRELNAKEGIEVVGTAPDPYVAREMIISLNPDVITLDVEMPRMDGITFLRKLMASRPMPVIVLSSLAEKGGSVCLEALEAGAVEVVRKPGSEFSVQEACDELGVLVRRVSRTYLPKSNIPKRCVVPSAAMTQASRKIIALGASTGGVQALGRVLQALPENSPGIVVVQHMPPNFTDLFARRLNDVCAVKVKEAEHNDPVVQGMVLIAPGNRHMTLEKSSASYHVKLNDNPPVCYQRPSVDVLFRSVAKNAGRSAVGALLTGMGSDGAEGLLEMRQAGASTIAQDEKTCVVFGMPKEAIRRGAADCILPLDKIAPEILKRIASSGKNGRCRVKE